MQKRIGVQINSSNVECLGSFFLVHLMSHDPVEQLYKPERTLSSPLDTDESPGENNFIGFDMQINTDSR